jgi:ABC-type multidrug transport system ATPase subunit
MISLHCIILGSLMMNGQLIENLECFKRYIAYVPQDDIIHDDLSVEENIVYAALLFNKRGYINAVEVLPMVLRSEVLLDISHIRTSVVGSPDRRGISGGQKKRVRYVDMNMLCTCIMYMCMNMDIYVMNM